MYNSGRIKLFIKGGSMRKRKGIAKGLSAVLASAMVIPMMGMTVSASKVPEDVASKIRTTYRSCVLISGVMRSQARLCREIIHTMMYVETMLNQVLSFSGTAVTKRMGNIQRSLIRTAARIR